MRIRLTLAALVAALAVVCPAQATLTSTSSSVTYTGNGVTTAFTVPFKFLASADLVVTVDNVTKTIATHYTVSGAGNTTGTVTFLSAPANATAVVITRLVDYTQRTSLKGSRAYDPTNIETTFDKLMMEIQQLGSLSFDALTFTAAGSGAVGRTATGKLRDFVSVKDFGALADGTTNDASAINTAIANTLGTLYLPASSTCYNIGTTTITLATGTVLQGAGMGGSSSGPSCIVYTGTGCAILLDSVSFAGVRDLDIQLNSASATARDICLKSTTQVAEFNTIERVGLRQTNATRRVAGQRGLWLDDTGNGVFWNTVRTIHGAYWDVMIELVGALGQGANANTFYDLMGWGNNVNFRIIATGGGFAADNAVYGLRCSRSDGTFAGTSTCFLLGDDGTNASFNALYTVVSDQAAPSVCGTIGAASGGNEIHADCESGGAVTDNNATGFPNYIYEPIAGATPGRLRVGRVAISSELDIGAATPLASTGDVRISNNRLFVWRNAANSGDITGIYIDSSDREKLGSSAAFLRLDNNIIEHGTGTVANSGSERYVHNWTNLGRNNANNANRTIWSWGATADTLILGDANATAQVAAPSTFTSTQNSGTCVLNAGTPATCTATVPSGSKCVAVPTGTTAAAATHTLATSVTTTTLTVTGANGLGDTVAYHCF